MPNTQPNPAIEYLRQNKDKYPLDVLRQKLFEAGYSKEAIDQAVLEVFKIVIQPQTGGNQLVVPKAATGFFDFKNVKSYNTFGEKFADFLLGWLVGIIFYVFVFVSFYFIFFVPVLAIFGIIHIRGIFYFLKRRHYLALGLLFAMLPMILLVLWFVLILFSLFYSFYSGSGFPEFY